MGFTPRDVDTMSLWELAACRAGWMKANGVEEKPAAPSADEHFEMMERLAARRRGG